MLITASFLVAWLLALGWQANNVWRAWRRWREIPSVNE
jgi:hypothetical protein